MLRILLPSMATDKHHGPKGQTLIDRRSQAGPSATCCEV